MHFLESPLSLYFSQISPKITSHVKGLERMNNSRGQQMTLRYGFTSFPLLRWGLGFGEGEKDPINENKYPKVHLSW
jgi:hypothetical protein